MTKNPHISNHSQADANQFIPPELQKTLYSPIGLAFLFCILALILVRLIDARNRGSKLARARWAGAREKTAARKLALLQIQERKHNRVALFIGTPKNTKVAIAGNKRTTYLPEDPSRLYLPDAQRGILVCGGPGSGKTFSMINPLVRSAIVQGFPIILYDFKYSRQESPNASAKGMAAKLAGYAVQHRYRVDLLTPGFPESSIANPIDFLRNETDAEMARQLAIVLNRNFRLTSGEKDGGFFSNAGDQLAQAIFMLAKGSQFPDVMMCHAILQLPKLIERISQANLHPWVEASFSQFLSVAGSAETAASIVGTAAGMFTRFMIPSALAAFCGQTSLPLDLKNRQLIVFGLDKEKRDVVGPLLVSVLHLLMSRNVSSKRFEPLILVLDELPTLYLPAVVDWLNQNREDGLVSILGFQNLSQLEDAYGKETTNAIFGGCATKAFFNPQDDVAAERFSKFLGEEEIRYKQRSRSTGGKSGASITNADQNNTRSLFEVNQFNSLPEGKAVIVNPGFRSRKEIGLPLLEQICIPKHDINAEKISIETWYKAQQEIVSSSNLKEPAGEEMKIRKLEAEKLLPLVDSTGQLVEKFKKL